MKHSKISAIRNMQFISNFKLSIIFLLCYALAVGGITVALFLTGSLSDLFFQVDTFVIATKVFLIILGAVTFYSTFKDYILQGVTRKEYVVGSLTAIAILCIFFTAVLTVVYLTVQTMKNVNIIVDDFVILMTASLVIFFAYYVIGWFLGMAYLKYKIIGQTISFIFAVIAIVLMELTTNIGFSSLVEGIEITSPTSIPLIYNLLSTVIIAFLFTYYVYSKAKKIYIRVD